MERIRNVVLCLVYGSILIAFPLIRASWGDDGIPICTAMAGQMGQKIASDGDGGAIITWFDYRNGYPDIYAQRVSASGVALWTPDGVALCTEAENQFFPSITSDGVGGAIIVWQDERSSGGAVYVQRVNASGVVQWLSNGVNLCTAAVDAREPQIISDGSGGAIITWHDYRNGNADVYTQRVDASGAVLWTFDGVIVCAASGYQNYPRITSDGSGGAIITWYDDRNGNNDIFAQRVDASGVALWTPDGVALCTATGDQWDPGITSDGSGGAIVTWHDDRSIVSRYDIYAQRIDASGAVQWVPDGVALCTAMWWQAYTQIASDGVGGAFIVWEDQRNNNLSWDIYAQRVNAAGTVLWTPDGVAICTALKHQRNSKVISDGTEGAIITWSDYRNEDWDIYIQRVNASGVAQWTAGGDALCAVTGDQTCSEIISDGVNGVIVTWEDDRSGNSDIYVELIQSITGDDIPSIPEMIYLSQNWPNPFNPSTTIAFGLREPAPVSLRVYDAAGRLVATLLEDARPSGNYTVEWNGRGASGTPTASGVYFYKLRAGVFERTRKMILLH